jgi:predicted secreted protein
MPMIKIRCLAFSLLTGLMLSQPLAALETEIRFDQVNLSAQASMQVENDNLIAVLYIQKEGSDPANLSDSVNRAISQAVAEAKQSEGVKLQTLGYQTSPIYQQQRLSGWRVRQSIRLESRQNEVLSDLLSRLQSSLALESINYAVSPERQRAVEESLIKQAIDAFRQRATLITQQWGRKTYRLVEMNIQTGNQPVPPMRMRASMMSLEGAVAAPTLEAGSQTLSVEVSGRIEMQLD